MAGRDVALESDDRRVSKQGLTDAPDKDGEMKPYVASRAARHHILYGDRSGGGHRFGANKGKSEFPRSWSGHAIIAAIEDVANNLNSTILPARGGRIILIGTRNAVSITDVVDPSAHFLMTGYPT